MRNNNHSVPSSYNIGSLNFEIDNKASQNRSNEVLKLQISTRLLRREGHI